MSSSPLVPRPNPKFTEKMEVQRRETAVWGHVICKYRLGVQSEVSFTLKALNHCSRPPSLEWVSHCYLGSKF